MYTHCQAVENLNSATSEWSPGRTALPFSSGETLATPIALWPDGNLLDPGAGAVLRSTVQRIVLWTDVRRRL